MVKPNKKNSLIMNSLATNVNFLPIYTKVYVTGIQLMCE